MTAALRASGDFYCKILYVPQNPVLYFSMWASGPPLDMLRRSAPVTTTNKKDAKAMQSNGTYRNSRYWLVSTHNVLWFYQYYGDIAPRFGVQIHDAQATIVKEKRRSTRFVNLYLPDGRTWLLDFTSKAEALRFEAAINENRKVHTEGKSIYIKASEANTPVPDMGFPIVYF
jgi:hypothetical protein